MCSEFYSEHIDMYMCVLFDTVCVKSYVYIYEFYIICTLRASAQNIYDTLVGRVNDNQTQIYTYICNACIMFTRMHAKYGQKRSHIGRVLLFCYITICGTRVL